MNITKSLQIACDNNIKELERDVISNYRAVGVTGDSSLYLIDILSHELGYELWEFIKLGDNKQ